MKRRLLISTAFVVVVGYILLNMFWPSWQFALTTPTPPTDALGRYIPPTSSNTQHCVSRNGLPDPTCTPGAVNPDVTQANIHQTICTKGYTKSIRPPVSYTNDLKRKQMVVYGFAGPLADYEEDHQIPLEVGGDPTNPANLWPEPHRPSPGSFDKDHVENYLNDQVCRGAMSLARAQQLIATDWVRVYRAVGPSITRY